MQEQLPRSQRYTEKTLILCEPLWFNSLDFFFLGVLDGKNLKTLGQIVVY
jgi:hypothetical protein